LITPCHPSSVPYLWTSSFAIIRDYKLHNGMSVNCCIRRFDVLQQTDNEFGVRLLLHRKVEPRAMASWLSGGLLPAVFGYHGRPCRRSRSFSESHWVSFEARNGSMLTKSGIETIERAPCRGIERWREYRLACTIVVRSCCWDDTHIDQQVAGLCSKKDGWPMILD
jgi:hypothetical protein